MSELEDKYGIYDIDADGVFPTPQKYLAAREITPSTDFEALGKAYANAYKNYAKASGFPEWQQDAYADDLATTYFSGVANKEAFDANYAARTGATPPTPAQPTELPYAGQLASTWGSFGGAVGGTISGLGDETNALVAKGVIPDALAREYYIGMDGVKSYTPAEYADLQLLDPEKYGKPGTTLFHAAGDPIKDFTAIPAGTQPNLVGSSIGSASGSLLTAAGAGLAGLGVKAATGLAVTQSAAQLANEGATNYRRTMAAQGKVVDEQALADTTLLNSALSAFDMIHLPGVAQQAAGAAVDSFGKRVAKTAGWEAATEAAQTTGQNVIASDVVGYDPNRMTTQGVGEAGEGGGIAGAFIAAITPGRGGATQPPPPPAADPNANVGNPADPNAPTGPSADPFDAARNATRQARIAATQEAASQNAAQAEQDMQTLNALMARTPAIRQGAEAQAKLEAEIAALEQQQAMDAQLGLGETQQVKDAAKALVAKQKELAKLGDQRAALKQMEGLQGQIESRTQGGGLSAIIASGEGDYGSFNRGVAGDARGAKIDFATITVGELQRRQALPAGHPDRVFAFGKYQIIPDTMTGAVKSLGLDPNTPVTPQLQEQIYQRYLTRDKQPAMRDYIEGKHSDLHAAQDALAGEWASIADPDTGRSRYGDRGGNKASISAGQAATGLIAARKIYADSIAQGLSPEVAWARAVGTGNVAGALPSQAQPHPDDVYLVDRAGNAAIQPFKPILNPTTDEAQAGAEPFKPILNPTTGDTNDAGQLGADTNTPGTSGSVGTPTSPEATPATSSMVASNTQDGAATPSIPTQVVPTPAITPSEEMTLYRRGHRGGLWWSDDKSYTELYKEDEKGGDHQVKIPSGKLFVFDSINNDSSFLNNKTDAEVNDELASRGYNAMLIEGEDGQNIFRLTKPIDEITDAVQPQNAGMAARTANPVDTEAVIAGIQTGDIPIQLFTKAGKPVSKQPTHEEVVKAHAAKKPTKRQQDIIAEVETIGRNRGITKQELPNVTPPENVTDPNGTNNAKPSGSPGPAGAATDAGRGNNMGDGTGATSQAADVQTGETSSTNGDVVDGQQTKPVDAQVQQAVVDPVAADVRADVEPITDTANAIDEAVWDADPPLSRLAESALYEVLGGGKPKTAQAVQTALRSFFRENYDGRGTEATFIAKHMKELRDSKVQESSVLDKLTKAYLGDGTDWPRLHLRNSQDTAVPEDKATAAAQRILGDVPFEPMPADAPTVEGKTVLGMVRNGKIYIDTKNMATVAEAEAVAIEELSHLGIQNLFGNQYTAKLKELFNGIGGRQGIEKFLQRSGVTMDDTYRSMDDVTLMDETLAHLAANKASLPVRAKRAVQQFIGYLRNVIRKYRTTALHNVVDSDLVYVASRARKAGKAGKKAASAAKPKPDTTPIRLHIRDPRQAANEAADEQLRQAHANRERGVDWNKIRAGTTTAGIWEAANQHLKNLGFKHEAAKKWFNNNLRTDHGMAQAIAVLQGVDIGWASRAKPKELRDLLFGNETARDVKSEARKVTDIKRKLTWDKSAVHAKTEDDIRKMEFWISQEYGKPVTKLTDAERAAISERIRTATPADPVAYAYRHAVDTSSQNIIKRLHTEMQTRINELNEAGREQFDDRADDLADPEVNVENLPPALQRIAALKRQTDMIKANLGSYMHRSYTAFHDPDWARKAKGSPEYHAAVEATMRNNEGMTEDDAITSINQLIDKIAGGVYDGLVGFAATGSKDHSILRKRKLADQPEIRALLGEITDPRYNYAYTQNSMAEFVASHIYQEQLRTAGLQLGFFTKEADGAFVTQFPQNKAWSMLSDVYTTRDVMDALESMNPLGAPEYRRIVWATSKVKKYKTIYSPTTAFRNLWSGALLLLQTGHMPFGKMGDAWDTLKNGTSYFGVSLIDPTNGGIRLADKEAQAMLADLARLGIIHNGAQSQDLLQLFNDVQTMDQQLKGRGWFGRNIEDRAVEFYRFGDDFYKMIHFFKETDDLVKSGLSPQQAKELAAKRTVDMMPSYDRIPRGLQQLRRFPLMGTFVSFPWEMVRTTKNVVYHALEDRAAGRNGMAAKKMLGLALAQGGLQGLLLTTMNAMLAGVDEEDDKLVNTLSPGWAKHQMRLYLGNEDGRVEFTNWSAIVPSDYMWKSARAAWEKGSTDGIYAGALAGFAATAAPFASEDLTFSTVGEILDNRAKDSGIPIYGKGKTFNDVFNDPEVTWRAAGHMLFKLGPGVVNNARDFAVANSTDAGEDAAWWNFLAESRGGKVSASGKTFTNLDATMALFGFRTTTLDMDILTEKASADAKTRLTYAKSDLRQKMDQSTALSDGAVQNAADRYLAERVKAVRPALAAIHYHKGEGKTISEIKKLLHAEVGTTLNEDEIAALVAGKMPDAALDKDAMQGMTRRAFRALDNSNGPNIFRAKQAITARMQQLQQYLKAKGSQPFN